MKKIIVFILILLAIIFLSNNAVAIDTPVTSTSTPQLIATSTQPVGPTLSHRQEVWRYALEWCESRGDKNAINKIDKDGTSSYYSFQFKPSTLKGYGVKYGLIDKSISQKELMVQLKSYELQKLIVGYMIFDPDVKWQREFPDCIRKNGFPPKK